MTCYSMACHKRWPCKTIRSCERVWHKCSPPTRYRGGRVLWICHECRAVWRWIEDDWWRDALKSKKK